MFCFVYLFSVSLIYYRFFQVLSNILFFLFITKIFGCQLVCTQKRLPITKTACITPWFEFSMILTINKPTRVTKHTAAAIHNIINCILNSNFKSAIVKTDLSDHFLIIFINEFKHNYTTIYTQLYNYLQENKILYSNQFGFQTGHSTGHAII